MIGAIGVGADGKLHRCHALGDIEALCGAALVPSNDIEAMEQMPECQPCTDIAIAR